MIAALDIARRLLGSTIGLRALLCLAVEFH